jgi:hypothetical protein
MAATVNIKQKELTLIFVNFHKVHNGLILTWKEIEDTIKYEVHKLIQSEI